MFKLKELEIPILGLGTRGIIGQPCRKLIKSAMEIGYRHIDTNPHFKNEMMIAEGLKGIPREELFITSKVPSQLMDYNEAIGSVEKTLKNMSLEYLDLVLIEAPNKADIRGKSHTHRSIRKRTWRALVILKNRGLIKNIGVANFLPRHIDEIWDKDEVNPCANQIEFHPFCYDEEVLNYHKEKNIQIIASSPLCRAKAELWHHPEFVEIKKRLKFMKAQILLKWAIQKGVAVVPMSTFTDKLEANTKLDFQLEDGDMKILDSLANGTRVGWMSHTVK